MTKNIELENIIKRIVMVSDSIKNVHECLADSYNDKELYNAYLKNLKLAIDLEQNLYNKIDSKTLSGMTNLIVKTINESDLDNYSKEEVECRIIDYVLATTLRYPFKETRETFNTNKIMNENIINQHITFDFNLQFYYHLLEAINNNKLKIIRPYLHEVKQQFLFRNKFFENLTFKENIDEPTPSSVKRLLAFNHDKREISKISSKFIKQGINPNIICALNYKNTEKTQENVEDTIISLVYIKSFLDLTSALQARTIFTEYRKNTQTVKDLVYLTKNNEIHNIIYNMIKDNCKSKEENLDNYEKKIIHK